MKCPTCGAGKLLRDTRDIPYTYKAETTIIPSICGDFALLYDIHLDTSVEE